MIIDEATKRAKVQQFLGNRLMAEVIREVIRSTFLKERSKLDVHALAAERLAISLLDQAFDKELPKYLEARSTREGPPGNPGV